MSRANFIARKGCPQVVGSFGNDTDLRDENPDSLTNCCDLAEIRLDILLASKGIVNRSLWQHLAEFPLLFTARRIEEGGAVRLEARQRVALIMEAIEDAALVDIEVSSIPEMTAVLRDIESRGIPWIASFHDFEKLPDAATLIGAAIKARNAGATIFKIAAKLTTPADVARLAEFQLTNHGILIASMGMGPLAPVSRLLCAQLGSLLNYGFIGTTPTAPGQWDSLFLKQAIARLAPL